MRVIPTSTIVSRYLKEYIGPSGLSFVDANRAKSITTWAAEHGMRPLERDTDSPYGYILTGQEPGQDGEMGA